MSAVEQDALRLFVASSKQRLLQLLHRLQWNEQGVLQQHRPPAVEKHTKSTDELPPSCMNSTKHSVQLDAATLQQLLGQEVKQLPQNFEELQSQYSASQKLKLYEHVIQCTPRQKISFEDNANFAELVAVTKKALNYKRRHRKSKPTLHEEMHQLVELQMQALQQQQEQREQKLKRKQEYGERREHREKEHRREQEREHNSRHSHTNHFRYRERQRDHRNRPQQRHHKQRFRSRSRSRSRSPQSSHSSRYHRRSHYN